MKVAVIGAGIVGAASAYALARAGHEVHLVDAASGPAQGASLANGAQLSYSYVEPLASPSTLTGLPAMLLAPRSPLMFRPRLDWRQWLWGIQFLAACTPAQTRRGTESLLNLARSSRDTLERWVSEEAWRFGFARNGKLVLCPSEASLAHQRAQVAFQASLGCEQQVLDTADCIAREPALAAYAPFFKGGVWTASECVADPHRLASAMVDSLAARGATMHWNQRARGWRAGHGRVEALDLQAPDGTRSTLKADAFVLATGVESPRLAARLGLHLPIYPLRGYSVTLTPRTPQRLPVASITDLSRKTVFAPLDGRLRVAAMVEMAGHDRAVPQERVQRMLDAADALFPGLIDREQDPRPWAGLRPATPTSVPIVGPAAGWSNLWLNVGHGALGLTLAAGSARAVAEGLAAARPPPGGSASPGA
jgi:D-amino-acid dehydrogenase